MQKVGVCIESQTTIRYICITNPASNHQQLHAAHHKIRIHILAFDPPHAAKSTSTTIHSPLNWKNREKIYILPRLTCKTWRQ